MIYMYTALGLWPLVSESHKDLYLLILPILVENYSPTSEAMRFYMIMPVRLGTISSGCKQQQEKRSLCIK